MAGRIKKLRADRELSIRQLAEEAGLNRMAISSWERSVTTPGVESVFRLATFFDVSADYIIGLDD